MSNAHKTRWLSSEHLLNASGCIILGNFNGNSTFLWPAHLLQQMHYHLPTTFLSQDDMKTCKSFARHLVRLMLRSYLRFRILGLKAGYHVELPLPPSNGIQLLVDFDANVTK